MNCYKETYERLVGELKELKSSRKEIFNCYSHFSGEYKSLSNKYDIEKMNIYSDWKKEKGNLSMFLLKLLIIDFSLFTTLWFVNFIISIFSSNIVHFISLLLLVTTLIIQTPFVMKKYSKMFRNFEIKNKELENNYENELDKLHNKLNRLSGELSRIDTNISCKSDEIGMLVMNYGKLCLGISDSDEVVYKSNRPYTRRKTIYDK